MLLLNRAADRREHIVRVRANQPDGSDYKHEDYRQHDRVFGDVLTLIISKKRGQSAHGDFPFD
jgi:hypothetical protein